MRLDSCEKTLIEGNIISLADANQVHYLFSRNVGAFNNLSAAGMALPLSEDVGGGVFKRTDTLEDKVQDGLLMSLS
jgi:hypothetical protein